MSWERPRCLRHRADAAGFACDGCGAALCPACTVRLLRGAEALDVCLLCGGLARPLFARRALLHPYRRLLLDDAATPSFAPGAVRLAAALAAGGALLRLASAEPLAQLLPYAAYGSLLAARFGPASRLRAAAGRAPRLKGDLALLGGFWVLAGLALGGAEELARALHPAPWVEAAAVALAATLVAAARLRALGLLLWARGDELGLFSAEGSLERVLPDAVPRGRLGSGEAELARERYGPFELAPGAAPASGGPRGGAADARLAAGGESAGSAPAWEEAPGGVPREFLELPPVPDASAPHALALALAAHDLDRAVAVFAQSEAALPPRSLSAQAWWALAQACLSRDRAELAVQGFLRAAAVAPSGPLSPQALLQAARARDERLRDRAGSDALLAELRRLYPESAEGRFAGRRLSASARA